MSPLVTEMLYLWSGVLPSNNSLTCNRSFPFMFKSINCQLFFNFDANREPKKRSHLPYFQGWAISRNSEHKRNFGLCSSSIYWRSQRQLRSIEFALWQRPNISICQWDGPDLKILQIDKSIYARSCQKFEFRVRLPSPMRHFVSFSKMNKRQNVQANYSAISTSKDLLGLDLQSYTQIGCAIMVPKEADLSAKDRWRCNDSHCRQQKQLKSDTWLQRSYLPLETIAYFIY